MPKFRFVVRAESGRVRRGTITEVDQQSAAERLTSSGFEIVSLEPDDSEIVIHEHASKNKGRPRPVRADIVDFEETLPERIKNFFVTYILRKEFALVLGAIGLVWLVVGSRASQSKANKEKKPNWVPYEISVSVSVDEPKADAIEVQLPSLPLTKKEPVEGGKTQKTVTLKFEALTRPQNLVVLVLDGDEVLWRGAESIPTGGATKISLSPVLEPGKAGRP